MPVENMTAEYDDDDEPLSPEEYVELKQSYDEVINSVHIAQDHIEKNDIEDAIHTLADVHSECSICQGEVDDAKHKLETIHEICNIEKTASDAKCQKMADFVVGNLNEFVLNINMALDELKSEAYGEDTEEDD